MLVPYKPSVVVRPGCNVVYLMINGEVKPYLYYDEQPGLDEIHQIFGDDAYYATEEEITAFDAKVARFIFPLTIKDRLTRAVQGGDVEGAWLLTKLCEDSLVFELLNRKRSKWYSGLVLYWLKDFWGDLQGLGLYEDEDFHRYAKELTAAEYGTYMGWLNAAETFLVNPESVEWIGERALIGYMDEEGRYVLGWMDVDISKAIRAAGATHKDEMDEHLRESLFDPDVDVQTYRHFLRTEPEEREKIDEEFVAKGSEVAERVYDETTHVFGFWKGGVYTEALIVAGPDDPIITRWLHDIIRCTNVKVVSRGKPRKEKWLE